MKLLFLCTGNSCRSQMAEGWARQLLPGDEILSAGLEAHGLNPLAIQVMSESGIDIRAQESTLVSDELIAHSDVVITVCGHADEHCPLVPAEKQKLHWPLPDPAKLAGTEEEILDGFRQVRDEIKQHIVGLKNAFQADNVKV